MILASIITELAFLVGVLGAVGIAFRLVTGRDFHSFFMKAGPMELNLKAIERMVQKVDNIDRRVNNVAPDAPSIPEQLTDIKSTVGHLEAEVAEIKVLLGDYMPGYEIATRFEALTAIVKRRHPDEFLEEDQ